MGANKRNGVLYQIQTLVCRAQVHKIRLRSILMHWKRKAWSDKQTSQKSNPPQLSGKRENYPNKYFGNRINMTQRSHFFHISLYVLGYQTKVYEIRKEIVIKTLPEIQ